MNKKEIQMFKDELMCNIMDYTMIQKAIGEYGFDKDAVDLLKALPEGYNVDELLIKLVLTKHLFSLDQSEENTKKLNEVINKIRRMVYVLSINLLQEIQLKLVVLYHKHIVFDTDECRVTFEPQHTIMIGPDGTPKDTITYYFAHISILVEPGDKPEVTDVPEDVIANVEGHSVKINTIIPLLLNNKALSYMTTSIVAMPDEKGNVRFDVKSLKDLTKEDEQDIEELVDKVMSGELQGSQAIVKEKSKSKSKKPLVN